MASVRAIFAILSPSFRHPFRMFHCNSHSPRKDAEPLPYCLAPWPSLGSTLQVQGAGEFRPDYHIYIGALFNRLSHLMQRLQLMQADGAIALVLAIFACLYSVSILQILQGPDMADRQHPAKIASYQWTEFTRDLYHVNKTQVSSACLITIPILSCIAGAPPQAVTNPERSYFRCYFSDGTESFRSYFLVVFPIVFSSCNLQLIVMMVIVSGELE